MDAPVLINGTRYTSPHSPPLLSDLRMVLNRMRCLRRAMRVKFALKQVIDER